MKTAAAPFTSFLFTLLGASLLTCTSAREYSNRSSAEWPGTGEWLALYQSLSTYAELNGPFEPEEYEQLCGYDEIDYWNPFIVATVGLGLCMQYPSCANKFCLEGDQRDDIPAYSLMAREESDIMKGVQFAHRHNIKVTIKTSGHSQMGASTAEDSLMIWLAHYPEDNTIRKYKDSCSDSIEHDVIGVSAGQNFDSIAKAVGDDYHFVSPSAETVGAAGGWIQGNGLSFTSRHYGLGVDNVVDFRIVLPSGAVAVADECTNPDLFWALRGGGGGTFGVVTHMNYKLHPKTPIVRVKFSLGSRKDNATALDKFVNFVVDELEELDTRWGGRFSGYDVDLFFAGALNGAKSTFLDSFDDWVMNDLDPEGILPLPSNTTEVYSSWSAVLPELSAEMDDTGKTYVTESTFSRIIPAEFVFLERAATIQLLKSLIISESLGYTNFLLGGNINNVFDFETSVHPMLRASSFLLTANQYGYEKLVQTLPNNYTGSSKNHHGGLEPDWRQSLWGENYAFLLEIKKLLDPVKLFNGYQSVGYEGPEYDLYNVSKYLIKPPKKDPIGVLDTSSAHRVCSGGTMLSMGLIAMGIIFGTL